MPQQPPHDSIRNGFGGFWRIVTWECHLCANNNWISDNNLGWHCFYPEKCRTRNCNHLRCIDCYDCDEDDVRLQHCDGAIIANTFDTSGRPIERFPSYEPVPADTRMRFVCPLQVEHECDRLFLSRDNATHHAAEVHRPVVRLSCGYVGCERNFSRMDDREVHLRTHPGIMNVCYVPGCGWRSTTHEEENQHLLTHFGRNKLQVAQNASQFSLNLHRSPKNPPQSTPSRLQSLRYPPQTPGPLKPPRYQPQSTPIVPQSLEYQLQTAPSLSQFPPYPSPSCSPGFSPQSTPNPLRPPRFPPEPTECPSLSLPFPPPSIPSLSLSFPYPPLATPSPAQLPRHLSQSAQNASPYPPNPLRLSTNPPQSSPGPSPALGYLSQSRPSPPASLRKRECTRSLLQSTLIAAQSARDTLQPTENVWNPAQDASQS